MLDLQLGTCCAAKARLCRAPHARGWKLGFSKQVVFDSEVKTFSPGSQFGCDHMLGINRTDVLQLPEMAEHLGTFEELMLLFSTYR